MPAVPRSFRSWYSSTPFLPMRKSGSSSSGSPVSSFSDNQDVAFEATACLAGRESQKTAVELDGLPLIK